MLARHCLVRGIIPAINAVNRRAFVQYLPDRYSDDVARRRRLRGLWDAGRRQNNGGDHSRMSFLISSIEATEVRQRPVRPTDRKQAYDKDSGQDLAAVG